MSTYQTIAYVVGAVLCLCLLYGCLKCAWRCFANCVRTLCCLPDFGRSKPSSSRRSSKRYDRMREPRRARGITESKRDRPKPQEESDSEPDTPNLTKLNVRTEVSV